MKEDFLQYLWRFQKLGPEPLTTDRGVPIRVVHTGIPNLGEGPDFLQAKLWIGETLWAGDVEVHIKAASWYHHRHHTDSKYEAVILHVVWENDVEVCYPSGRTLPCLKLSNRIPPQWWKKYYKSFEKKTHWIPCEKGITQFPDFKWQNWIERLYLERLESKTIQIKLLLHQSKNNWEGVLFQLLAKNFGLNLNGAVFLKWAQHLPFQIVQKISHDGSLLEALFMGISGLLSGEMNSAYKKQLRSEYDYLKQKFGFKEIPGIRMQFKGLRPPNFPTIRLSQLAQFYTQNPRPFFRLIQADNLMEFDWIRKVGVSPFWETHYTFDKSSPKKSKKISQPFLNLLLINTLIPLRFAYYQSQGGNAEEKILQWIGALPAESNSITKGFTQLGINLPSALFSQSLLQLKAFYCDPKKCLRCAVGFHLFDFST